MADQNTSISPADAYAQRLQAQLNGLAKQFLVKLVGQVAADRAAAKIGLAMRQLALANPDIYQASPQHIANAVALCALTDLTPGGQNADCWVFPKSTKGVAGIQFMISHRGYKKLARRAGWEVDCVLVHGPSDELASNGDEWLFERNPFPTLRHVPHQNEPRWDTVQRAYCYFWPVGRREEWGVYILEKNELAHRRAANTAGPVWNEWPLEMCLKATVKAAAARGAFPLDDVGRAAMDELDLEVEDVPVIDVPSTRPAPAPERIATPPRSSVQRLADTLGPDSEDEDTREADPVPVGQPEPEKTKRTRGPNKPKPETAMREAERVVDGAVKDFNERHDEAKLNNQHELLLRVQEAERKVGGNILTSRTAHGISPTLNASQVVKQCPEAAVIAYCRELEA